MSFYYNGVVGPDRRVIFYPHIPRTAGRFVSEIFLHNDFLPYYEFYNQKVENVSLPHMDREMYVNFFDKDSMELPSFTVVRNPIDRFISAYRVTKEIHSLPDINTFAKNLPSFYKKNQRSLDNFLTHQHKFIKKGMKLWKFEKGFDQEFCDWINKNFHTELKYDPSIKLKYAKSQHEKMQYEESCVMKEKLSITSKLILLKFYWKDFFIWFK